MKKCPITQRMKKHFINTTEDQQMALVQLDLHMRKNEVGPPTSHHMQK